MYKILTAVLVAWIALASSTSEARAGAFSATGTVIAILAGELFVGEAEGHLNGAGTIAIHSQSDPAITCLGRFTSSAALGGSGEMNCSDGASATFQFQRLSVFRGYGDGSYSRGPMSFVYGLSAKEAAPYLKVPEGKKLRHNGIELLLVDLLS